MGNSDDLNRENAYICIFCFLFWYCFHIFHSKLPAKIESISSNRASMHTAVITRSLVAVSNQKTRWSCTKGTIYVFSTNKQHPSRISKKKLHKHEGKRSGVTLSLPIPIPDQWRSQGGAKGWNFTPSPVPGAHFRLELPSCNLWLSKFN